MNSQDRSLQKWTPASTPRPALDQLNVCPSLDAAVARSDCCSFPEQLAAVSWPVLRSCSSRARPTPTPSRTSTMRWFTIRRFCSRACEACEAILRSTLTPGRVRLSSCRSSCSALLRQGRLFQGRRGRWDPERRHQAAIKGSDGGICALEKLEAIPLAAAFPHHARTHRAGRTRPATGHTLVRLSQRDVGAALTEKLASVHANRAAGSTGSMSRFMRLRVRLPPSWVRTLRRTRLNLGTSPARPVHERRVSLPA